MLAGRLPFDSGDIVELIHMHESVPIPSLRHRRPDIPEELEAVVLKMMAKIASERYQNAVDIIRDLRPYLFA